MTSELLSHYGLFETIAGEQGETPRVAPRRSPAYIRWVQRRLNRILGLRLPLNGKLGVETRSGIRSFQKRRGLSPDGRLNRRTVAALAARTAAAPAPAAAATGPVVMPPLVVQVRPFVVLDGFPFKQPTMPSQYGAIVNRIAHLIVASRISGQPIATVRLVGHTDSTGPASFNMTLGTQRAAEVKAKLEDAIKALGTVPSAPLTIVVQSRGETAPIASNAKPEGRAKNRRVEVFLPTTCQTFFAQYDLRFLPDDPIFGIPAYPGLTGPEKDRRRKDVLAMVDELVRRRNDRARDAIAGKVPPPVPLPADTGPDSLRRVAARLSNAQLNLYRSYFPDGSGGIDFEAFQQCFEQFANGELRSPIAADQAAGIGEPNSDFFFLFAEFAFLCIDSGLLKPLWASAARAFVKAQEIFMHVYRPGASSPPPAVGAAIPKCPLDAQGKATPRRSLAAYKNGNFSASGTSANVGAGQSDAARKKALRAKYGAMDAAALKLAAQQNMQRAQCMP